METIHGDKSGGREGRKNEPSEDREESTADRSET